MGIPSLTGLELTAGAIIGGCRIDRKIGRGAMGAVFECRQLSLDRRVAVKIFARAGDDPGERLRVQFIQEARLSAKLNHPNIVQVFDVGIDGEIHFIVMEYVEGVTLKEVLVGQPRLAIGTLLHVATQIARGLAAAHEAKIIHRDIKPENILLTARGDAKIADFGAGGFMMSADATSEKRGIIGTPAYLAPEVLLGEPVEGRADVYALGLLLYGAAAGAHPFPHKDMKRMLQAQVHDPVPPLINLRPELPPDLAKLIQRLCAKKPHERCSSQELLEILEEHGEWGRETGSARATAPSAALVASASAAASASASKSESASASVAPSASPPGSAAPPGPKKSILDVGLRRERSGPAQAPRAEKGTAPPSGAPGPKKDPFNLSNSPKTDPRLEELFIRARFQLMKKDLRGAEHGFRAALVIDPVNDTALLGLARLYTEQSRFPEAIEELRKAMELGRVEPRRILDAPHFQALKGNKEFICLMARHPG